MPVEDQLTQVYAATNGYLDRVKVDRVPEFLDQLTKRVHSEHEDLLGKIGEGDWSDEIVDKLDGAIKEFADDFGYDLDEDGQPMEDGDSDRVKSREEQSGSDGSSNGRAKSDGDDTESAADGESESESEEAGATA